MNEIAAQYEAAIKYGRLDPDDLYAFHNNLWKNSHPLPHLVFADYLEENGHPEVADLIRRAAQSEATDVKPVHHFREVIYDENETEPSMKLRLYRNSPSVHSNDNVQARVFFKDGKAALPEDGSAPILMHRTIAYQTAIPKEDGERIISSLFPDSTGEEWRLDKRVL